MKNQILVVLMTLCLFLTSCNGEKNKEEIHQPESEKAFVSNTKDVEIAVENFNKALVDRQKDVLEKSCVDELTYGHSSGLIQDKTEFIDDVINGSFDFLSIDTPEQTIHILGNTAIVRHVFLAQASKEGEPVEVRIGNLLVYQMSDIGEWRLLARQAYKI